MIREALERLPVAAAWIFGSVARGDSGDESDLDLAILPQSPLQPEHVDALRSLAVELGPWSPCGRVDVLVLGAQGPVLRHRVIRDGIRVYDGDPETRIAFEGRTIAEYLDWKPTHDIAMRSTLEGIRDRLERSQ